MSAKEYYAIATELALPHKYYGLMPVYLVCECNTFMAVDVLRIRYTSAKNLAPVALCYGNTTCMYRLAATVY